MVASGGEEGGMTRQSTEDSEGSETALYETMLMDTCQHTLGQTQRVCNTKRGPCVNNARWVTCSIGAGSSIVTNVPLGWGRLCRGVQRTYGKSLYFLLNFDAKSLN